MSEGSMQAPRQVAWLFAIILFLSGCHGNSKPILPSLQTKSNAQSKTVVVPSAPPPAPAIAPTPTPPAVEMSGNDVSTGPPPAPPAGDPSSNSDVEIHYSPEENLAPIDARIIASAMSEISISAYSFTDREVSEALQERALHGVTIRVYRDHGSTKEELNRARVEEAPILNLAHTAAVEVRIKHSSVLAHLKAYEVDGKILRTGSANFSPGGENRQDNDLVLIYDRKVVSDFKVKFDNMWNRPDNQTLK